MAKFTKKLVSMVRSQEEKKEELDRYSSPSVSSVADYPYGLSIRLTEEDLEKLDLDDDCEVGDTIDIRAMAKVTSVSKRQTDGENRCDIELQITDMAVEGEDSESE